MTNEICATVPMGSNGIVDSARCLLLNIIMSIGHCLICC